jgi:hypothetical protein
MLKQATAAMLISLGLAFGQGEGGAAFDYDPPVVEKPFFDDTLSMFEAERTEYATNLATFAANEVVTKMADPESLASARRILALAMHLDRRNRMAIVVNGQLKRGVLPAEKPVNYNPATFSRLLLARAKMLGRRDNEREVFLSHCFTEIAALIDPRNEDAVFDYENQLIDAGEIDWRLLTDAAADKPSLAPEQ